MTLRLREGEWWLGGRRGEEQVGVEVMGGRRVPLRLTTASGHSRDSKLYCGRVEWLSLMWRREKLEQSLTLGWRVGGKKGEGAELELEIDLFLSGLSPSQTRVFVPVFFGSDSRPRDFLLDSKVLAESALRYVERDDVESDELKQDVAKRLQAQPSCFVLLRLVVLPVFADIFIEQQPVSTCSYSGLHHENLLVPTFRVQAPRLPFHSAFSIPPLSLL